MTYEILYTSAPAGLKPGSSGYCTVKGSRGIPSPTLDLLESLSGYRHVFTPGTPEAAYNPVNWGHYLLRISGRMEHVLSRVSDCEPDYTGRSNKLAHHMVVDDAACPAGPAWLLGQRGWMTERWDGQVEQLSSVRTPPAARRAPGRCVAWEGLGLDPGWAGVMAESFLTDPDRKVFVIYKPGKNILPLFEEALSLLPENRRWDVTFATYGAALPSTVDCLWSGIVAGSPEVQQSRRFVNALRIDLTRPEPAQNGGALVDLARTGVARKAAPPPARSTPQRPVAPPIELAEVERPEPSQRRSPVPPPPDTLWEPEPPSLPPRQQGGSRAGLWIILSSALLVVCAAAGTTTYLIVNRPQPDAVAEGKEETQLREKGATAVVADAGASKQEERRSEQAPMQQNDGKGGAGSGPSNPMTAGQTASRQEGSSRKPGEGAGTAETKAGGEPAMSKPASTNPPVAPVSGGPDVAVAPPASGQLPSVPNPRPAALLPVQEITSTGKRSDKNGIRFEFPQDQKFLAEPAPRFCLLIPHIKKMDDGPAPYHDIYSQRLAEGEIRVVSKGGLESVSQPLVTAVVRSNPMSVVLTETGGRDAQLRTCLAHGGMLIQDSAGSQNTILLFARSHLGNAKVQAPKDFIIRVQLPNEVKALAELLKPEDMTLSRINLTLHETLLAPIGDRSSVDFRWNVPDEARISVKSISISRTAEIKDGFLLLRIQCEPPFSAFTDHLELDKQTLSAEHTAIVEHFKRFFPESFFSPIKYNAPSKADAFAAASKSFRSEIAAGFDHHEKKLAENKEALKQLRTERQEWLEKIDGYLGKVLDYRVRRECADGFKENLRVVSGGVSYRIWPLQKSEGADDVGTLPESKKYWDVPWWTFGGEPR